MKFMIPILVLCSIASADPSALVVDAAHGHMVMHADRHGGCASPKATSRLIGFASMLRSIEITPGVVMTAITEVTTKPGETSEHRSIADRCTNTTGQWFYVDSTSGAAITVLVDADRYAWATNSRGDQFSGEVTVTIIQHYRGDTCSEAWVAPAHEVH